MDRKSDTVRLLVPVIVCALLLTGCESLQRKFRRPRKKVEPPSPILQFKNYAGAMTPLERYRKHYLMFDYWNAELLEELADDAPNRKRIQHASTESLTELKTMQSLVAQSIAAKFDPVIEERTEIHEQLKVRGSNPSRNRITKRRLDAQTRHIQREFYWRDLEDQFKQ